MASYLEDMKGKSVYLEVTAGILLLVSFSRFRLYFLAGPNTPVIIASLTHW
jgi:hypothetical protein